MFGTMTNNLIIGAVVVSAVVLAGTKVYVEGKRAGVAETTAAWQQEKAALSSEYIAVLKEARAKEQQLQHQANVMRLEHQREIETLRTRHSSIVAGLQQRPQKRASEAAPATCSDSSAGVGSTGKELARPDAEFLVGFAAEVEQLQQAYNECRQKYNALRNTL